MDGALVLSEWLFGGKGEDLQITLLDSQKF